MEKHTELIGREFSEKRVVAIAKVEAIVEGDPLQ